MKKELKYFFFVIIIFLFTIFTVRHYFSNENIKKSYREINKIDNKINIYKDKLPVLENNTDNIIEYIDINKNKKKKKFFFWELLNEN